jgi:GNAT superfamily N-acetyltransferase
VRLVGALDSGCRLWDRIYRQRRFRSFKQMSIRIRQAVTVDIPVLRALIDASVRGLQAQDYTPTQIEGALKTVYGVDSQLIADGTYFVAEVESAEAKSEGSSTGAGHEPKIGASRPLIVGCGGWSKRKTLYGGDQWTGREAALLDPQQDAAKIRAFFVHPAWARRGIGTMILDACESAAMAAGFTRFEMGATLTGVPFYRIRGYLALEDMEVPLAKGVSLPIVHMEKRVRAKEHRQDSAGVPLEPS